MTKRAVQLVILTLIAATVPAAAADGAPRATVPSPILDLGDVVRGETIQADFEIRNEGTAPLEITEVRPACGCTVADYDDEIPPGGTGRIHAEVETDAIVGPNSKGITVFTNDPSNPRIQLTIKSNVKPFLYVTPGYARFTNFVQSEAAQTLSQTLWADDFENLQVTGVETGNPHVTVAYREAREGEREPQGVGRQWRIDITLAEDAPPGPLADKVLITTNHPKQKTTDIPVSGFVRPMVAVTPPRVDFGEIPAGSDQQWGVLVRNFGERPLELGTVESEIPGVSVEVESVDQGRQYKLVFTPTAALPKGPFAGKVRIHTNLPQVEAIVVDLEGEVI